MLCVSMKAAVAYLRHHSCVCVLHAHRKHVGKGFHRTSEMSWTRLLEKIKLQQVKDEELPCVKH